MRNTASTQLRNVVIILIVAGGCRDSTPRVAGGDTTRPGAGVVVAPAVPATSTGDTTTTLLPRAGAPPALAIGAAVVRLDSTSMARVAETLGAGPVVGDTVGGDRLMTACYRAGIGAEAVTIELTAEGGTESNATARQGMAAIKVWKVSITRGAGDAVAKVPCGSVSISAATISWSNGLRLGMTRGEAERRLGPPRKTEDGDTVYEYDNPDYRWTGVDPKTGRVREFRDYVTYSFRVRYDADVATRIEARYAREAN